MSAPVSQSTQSLLLDKVVSLEAAVGNFSEVLTQVHHLGVASHVGEEHDDADANQAQQDAVVDVHLRLDVRRVLETVSSTENRMFVEVLQKEGVLTWHSEHVELVLVVGQADRALAEGALGGLWQVGSVHFGPSKELVIVLCGRCDL